MASRLCREKEAEERTPAIARPANFDTTTILPYNGCVNTWS
jgi:hypothetical protein